MWRCFWVSACALLCCSTPLWGKPAALPFLNDLDSPVDRAAGAALAGAVWEPLWSVSSLRVPEARSELRAPEPGGGSSTAGHLVQEASSARLLQTGFALWDGSLLRLHAGFRSSGAFARVDSGGSSVHAFPSSDLLLGFGLQQRFGSRIAANAAFKWVRAKRDAGPVDHAAAWDAGIAFLPSDRWRFGVSARNWSGSDLSALGFESRIRGEAAFGARRVVVLSPRFRLELSADARLPSERGAQGSGGASLIYKDSLAFSAGYLRRAEVRRSLFLPVDGGAAAPDERLWTRAGPTAGGWLRLGEWRIGVSASPSYLPEGAEAPLRYQWSVEIARRL